MKIGRKMKVTKISQAGDPKSKHFLVGRPREPKGKLFFLQGRPRSGKGVWSQMWLRHDITLPAQYYDVLKTPRVVICGDDYREALYGRHYQIEAEGFVFACMDVSARAQLNAGRDVLIDETCSTEATLLRYLRLDINATPIWIDTPEEVCIQRAIDTNKPYLIEPIKRIGRQLEYLKKHWDETVHRLKMYLRDRAEDDVAV